MKNKIISRHIPVLLQEVLGFLKIKDEIIVVDATFGEGGHSEEILKKLKKSDELVAIDVDKKAKENFEKIIGENSNAVFFQGNFKDIQEILKKKGIDKVDFILADLGWRTQQIKNDEYGLNFSSKQSLSMRLDRDDSLLTAEKIINDWPVKELERIFRIYGEEKMAFKASLVIQKARSEKRINSSGELAGILEKELKRFNFHSKLHPATKIFQALRIFVNKELENLEIFLEKSLDCLNVKGRLAIITFHSGEDRIVKNFFRAKARGCVCPSEFPKCICGRKPVLKILTKKPIVPSAEEIQLNPRSRSAKLRVIEKI